jgi:hypothetical protein
VSFHGEAGPPAVGPDVAATDGIAVTAVLLSLGIEVLAIWVAVALVKLACNWRRHRQQRAAPTSVPVP